MRPFLRKAFSVVGRVVALALIAGLAGRLAFGSAEVARLYFPNYQGLCGCFGVWPDYSLRELGWPAVYRVVEISPYNNASEPESSVIRWPWLAGDVAWFALVVGGAGWWLFWHRSQCGKRRWQFQVSHLLALVLLLALPLGSLARAVSHARHQQAGGRFLIEHGWDVSNGYVGPRWLQLLCSDAERLEQFQGPIGFSPVPKLAEGAEVTDGAIMPELLAALGTLRHIQVLELSGTNLTDQGLLQLLETPLKETVVQIDFSGTSITGSGLAVPLPQLRCVVGNDCQLDDAGFSSLADFPRLLRIDALDTKISAAALRRAVNFPQLREIWLNRSLSQTAECDALAQKGVQCQTVTWP